MGQVARPHPSVFMIGIRQHVHVGMVVKPDDGIAVGDQCLTGVNGQCPADQICRRRCRQVYRRSPTVKNSLETGSVVVLAIANHTGEVKCVCHVGVPSVTELFIERQFCCGACVLAEMKYI